MISGVVLARNEEVNIVGCLEALQPHVDEILLIDMESSDRTVELATPYVDRLLTHPLVRNFDGARNIAIDAAQHDWLWFVDADERIPAATGQLIRETVRNHGDEFEAISIPFKSYCGGQWMKHCGWWPGYTGTRVLKRGHFRYADRIHGGVKLDGRELRVAPDSSLGVDHYGIRDIEHYTEKVNRYSSAEAENLAAAEKRWDWRAAISDMMQEMWLTYERHPGNLDGEWGWVAAWMSGQYRWLAQSKLLDWNRQPSAQPNPSAAPRDLDDVVLCMEDALAQLRAWRPVLPWGVVWKADIDKANGYSEEARTFLKGLARGPRQLALEVPFQCPGAEAGSSLDDQALFQALRRARRPRHCLTVTHALPGVAPPDPRSTVNVLRTMIETDRVPSSWLSHIMNFDEVWVPSQHSFEAFRRSWVPPEKLRIVPGCLDTEVFQPNGETVPLPQPLQGRFVFLSVFDWTPRKGGELLLENYCREFSPDEGVGLLLKVARVHGMTCEEIQEKLNSHLKGLGQSLAERPDIYLLDEETSTREMAALYRSVDAFVLPTRGEGWGRPLMEAMACGLPTIGTAATGQLEFMTEENSFLIPAEEADVPAQAVREFPLFTGHRWHEPNATELRRLMRQVIVDADLRQRIASQAARDIQSKFHLAAGAAAVEAAVKAAEQRFEPLVAPPVHADQSRVLLEGELFSGHSFSNINEQLCRSLSQDLSLAMSVRRLPSFTEERPAFAREVEASIDRELPSGPQVTIRHAYPPNWTPPEQGQWVHVQPWEYGHLPTDWLAPLREQVDEIWAPSEYVKKVYQRSGIPAEKIQVIPWGVDSQVFTPTAPPLFLPTGKHFHFLFVGGTIARKGYDRLLEAYLAEFGPDDDVGLVVKDIGSRTVYRHLNHARQTLAAQDDPNKPAIHYIDAPLSQGQLASLYTACDCLVAPYRGEGFGLPILEAMACGVAPIIPQGGPTDDFANPETAYLVESEEVEVEIDLSLCGPALELDIRQEDLQRIMRQAVQQHAITKAKGASAADHVHRHFTWQQTAERMSRRIEQLASRPPRSRPASSPTPRPDGNMQLHAMVHNASDDAETAETLGSTRPYVDKIICQGDNPSHEMLALANEYRAEFISDRVEIGDEAWVLHLQRGEMVDVDDIEEVIRFLSSLPASTESVGVEVQMFQDGNQLLESSMQSRLVRGKLLRQAEATEPTAGLSKCEATQAFASLKLKLVSHSQTHRQEKSTLEMMH